MQLVLVAVLLLLRTGTSTRIRDERLIIRENRAVASASRINAIDRDRYEYRDEPIVEDNYYDQVYQDVDDEEDEEKKFSGFLDELKERKRLLQQEEDDRGYDGRRGRRRKLNSHEQGMLLVEALGKRQKNFTGINDHRGYQSPDVHNGIMDMLGRSM